MTQFCVAATIAVAAAAVAAAAAAEGRPCRALLLLCQAAATRDGEGGEYPVYHQKFKCASLKVLKFSSKTKQIRKVFMLLSICDRKTRAFIFISKN